MYINLSTISWNVIEVCFFSCLTFRAPKNPKQRGGDTDPFPTAPEIPAGSLTNLGLGEENHLPSGKKCLEDVPKNTSNHDCKVGPLPVIAGFIITPTYN